MQNSKARKHLTEDLQKKMQINLNKRAKILQRINTKQAQIDNLEKQVEHSYEREKKLRIEAQALSEQYNKVLEHMQQQQQEQ